MPIFPVFLLLEPIKLLKNLLGEAIFVKKWMISVDAVDGSVLNKEEQWKNGFFALSHRVSKRF